VLLKAYLCKACSMRFAQWRATPSAIHCRDLDCVGIRFQGPWLAMGMKLRKSREVERGESWADEPSKQKRPQKSGCRTRDAGSYVSAWTCPRTLAATPARRSFCKLARYDGRYWDAGASVSDRVAAFAVRQPLCDFVGIAE
jgi:hypothetical protein